jgi:lysophospholipase L1-like esterase
MLKIFFIAASLLPATVQAQHLLVIIGSSTAAGTGATNYDSSFAGRYGRYLPTLSGGWRQTNLAVGGYVTYQLMPTNFRAPAGRPAPDTIHNVTKALSLHPDVLLFALGDNDIGNGYDSTEYQSNYDSIRNAAVKAGVRIWISSTLPRNIDSIGRKKILAFRSRILTRYAPRALDFYDSLGLPDGSYNPAYNSGDGIHTNDRGHLLLFQRLVAANLTALPSFVIQSNPRFGPIQGRHSGLIWDERIGGSPFSNRVGSLILYDMQGRQRLGSFGR